MYIPGLRMCASLSNKMSTMYVQMRVDSVSWELSTGGRFVVATNIHMVWQLDEAMRDGEVIGWTDVVNTCM